MDYRDRFKGAPWANTPLRVTVYGAGSLGSWLTLLLSRIGHDIQLVDYDVVEEVNLAGQFFRTVDVGSTKVSAVANNVRSFSGENIRTQTAMVREDNAITLQYGNIAFSCFDNLQARKDIANMFLDNNLLDRQFSCLVDIRMSAESFEVYLIKNNDELKHYLVTLPNDNDVEDLPCTLKSTSHIAMHATCKAVEVFNNFLTNEFGLDGFEEREVFYKYRYDSILMKETYVRSL
jgi:hypothetical protein